MRGTEVFDSCGDADRSAGRPLVRARRPRRPGLPSPRRRPPRRPRRRRRPRRSRRPRRRCRSRRTRRSRSSTSRPSPRMSVAGKEASKKLTALNDKKIAELERQEQAAPGAHDQARHRRRGAQRLGARAARQGHRQAAARHPVHAAATPRPRSQELQNELQARLPEEAHCRSSRRSRRRRGSTWCSASPTPAPPTCTRA